MLLPVLSSSHGPQSRSPAAGRALSAHSPTSHDSESSAVRIVVCQGMECRPHRFLPGRTASADSEVVAEAAGSAAARIGGRAEADGAAAELSGAAAGAAEAPAVAAAGD